MTNLDENLENKVECYNDYYARLTSRLKKTISDLVYFDRGLLKMHPKLHSKAYVKNVGTEEFYPIYIDCATEGYATPKKGYMEYEKWLEETNLNNFFEYLFNKNGVLENDDLYLRCVLRASLIGKTFPSIQNAEKKLTNVHWASFTLDGRENTLKTRYDAIDDEGLSLYWHDYSANFVELNGVVMHGKEKYVTLDNLVQQEEAIRCLDTCQTIIKKNANILGIEIPENPQIEEVFQD